MRIFLSAITAALLTTPLAAQERPNTILVLDASGSMWGQIDGINKIVIAREVVADIIADFPADQNLGLTLYGHRTRGDCTDIETVIAPGIDNRPAILDAVNAINPRGMTPMTDAIVAAADSLRYTENAATVILVSDGIETCNPDPCAAARALEEAGVGFTAHVVGFDVANEPDALAQMQCLAEETGGRFLTAANADELATALETVVADVPPPPEPPPEPVIVPQATTFRATLGQDGPEIATPLVWELLGPDGAVVQTEQAPGFTAELTRGAYAVSVLRPEDEAFAESTVIVMNDPQTVTLVLPPPTLTASLVAQASAPMGATIPVGWDGPGEDYDFIGVGPVGDPRYITYAYATRGNPVDVVMPGTPGDYEIRYYSQFEDQILATSPVTVTKVDVALTAPDSAGVGDTVPVDWVGPGYDNDFIGIGLPGEPYINYAYTNRGNPAAVVMPTEPGSYELRYYLGLDESILATRMITVGEQSVSLVAPATAAIGAALTVGWDGPGNDNDFIGIGLPGERYTNYTYTNRGNPLDLLMPSEPGDYEIRYYLGQGETVLAAIPIRVEQVDTGLTAPASAPVGATVDIGWTGPGQDNDFIGIGLPGERYTNYAYVNRGNPAPLLMPSAPGDYEIRYYLGQDESVLATVSIRVEPVDTSVTAPATAPAGATVVIGWTGPGQDNDFIGIGLPGEGYINYVYVNRGNPAPLQLPTAPGSYEIRYYLGQDDSVLASTVIEVTAISAALTAPTTAPAATTLQVNWKGPDYDGDFIGIGRQGETGYVTYVYTNRGNPATINVPEEPGDYEIRYFLGQGDTQLTAVPLTVTAP
jgi:Ca-activated chloride channel family protein